MGDQPKPDWLALSIGHVAWVSLIKMKCVLLYMHKRNFFGLDKYEFMFCIHEQLMFMRNENFSLPCLKWFHLKNLHMIAFFIYLFKFPPW